VAYVGNIVDLAGNEPPHEPDTEPLESALEALYAGATT
jgi:hypothetical protein